MHNFDLNAPSSSNDDQSCEGCINCMTISSINASAFEDVQKKAQAKCQVVCDFDLNASPSTYNDERSFEDYSDCVPISFVNASLFGDVQKEAQAKDQDAMYCIDLNASPLLDNGEQKFEDCAVYLKGSSTSQVIHKMPHEVMGDLMIVEEPSPLITSLSDASNPFDIQFNAPNSSNACDPFDGSFGMLSPFDPSCFSQRSHGDGCS